LAKTTRSFFAQLVSTPILDRLLYSTGVATSNGIRTFLEQRQFARSSNRQEIVDAYLESAQQPNAEYAALLCAATCALICRFTFPVDHLSAIIWGSHSPVQIGRRFANINPQAIRVFQPLEEVGLTPQLELPAVQLV